MDLVIRLALLLSLSCAPLVEPSAGVRRCAKPCPSTCAAGACLPSGVCSRVVETAAQLGLAPLPEGGTWTLAASGFPPHSEVAFLLDGGFDIAARAGQLPSWIHLLLISDAASLLLQNQYDAFPVWGEADAHAQTDATGAVTIPFLLHDCRITGPSVCSISPDSTLTVTLVDTRPWLVAPPCD